MAHRVALGITRHHHDAEDATQQGMLHLLARLDRFDRSQPIDPWLGAIVQNAARDIVRKRFRFGCEPLPDPCDGLRVPAGQEAFEERIADRDAALRAWQGLKELTPEQRDALRMTLLEGGTQAEAAAELGIPVNTVKSRVRRGVERLRTLVNGPG